MTATPTNINVTADKIEITWSDGKKQNLTARLLRAACNCASCVSEITGERTLDVSKIPANIQISAAEPTGNYAISLKFSDYHNTGIFTFEALRNL